jgi:hypothetical protein
MRRRSAPAARLLAAALLAVLPLGFTASPVAAAITGLKVNHTALLVGEGTGTGAVISGTVASTDASVRIRVVLVQSYGEEGGAYSTVHVGSVTLAGHDSLQPWAVLTAPAALFPSTRALLPGPAQISVLVESFDAGGKRVGAIQSNGVIMLVRDVRYSRALPSPHHIRLPAVVLPALGGGKL